MFRRDPAFDQRQEEMILQDGKALLIMFAQFIYVPLLVQFLVQSLSFLFIYFFLPKCYLRGEPFPPLWQV